MNSVLENFILKLINHPQLSLQTGTWNDSINKIKPVIPSDQAGPISVYPRKIHIILDVIGINGPFIRVVAGKAP